MDTLFKLILKLWYSKPNTESTKKFSLNCSRRAFIRFHRVVPGCFALAKNQFITNIAIARSSIWPEIISILLFFPCYLIFPQSQFVIVSNYENEKKNCRRICKYASIINLTFTILLLINTFIIWLFKQLEKFKIACWSAASNSLLLKQQRKPNSQIKF